MNRHQKTKWMVYNALLIAIIAVLAAVPWLGFIPVGPLSITTVHIPVIIGGILFGWKSGLLLGIAFGISSMLVASTRGGVTDLLFINPFVSVLPRIIFGLSISCVYELAKKIFKGKSVLAIGTSAFVSSLVHSIVVLVAIFTVLGLQSGLSFGEAVSNILAILLGGAVLGEAIAAMLVSVGVVSALLKTLD